MFDNPHTFMIVITVGPLIGSGTGAFLGYYLAHWMNKRKK